MAVLTRLELATSAVTGQRSNQLSYSTIWDYSNSFCIQNLIRNASGVYISFSKMQIDFYLFLYLVIKVVFGTVLVQKINITICKYKHYSPIVEWIYFHEARKAENAPIKEKIGIGTNKNSYLISVFN